MGTAWNTLPTNGRKVTSAAAKAHKKHRKPQRQGCIESRWSLCEGIEARLPPDMREIDSYTQTKPRPHRRTETHPDPFLFSNTRYVDATWKLDGGERGHWGGSTSDWQSKWWIEIKLIDNFWQVREESKPQRRPAEWLERTAKGTLVAVVLVVACLLERIAQPFQSLIETISGCSACWLNVLTW